MKESKLTTEPEPKSILSRFIHPEIRSGKDVGLLEKRNIISSVFIAMLIGLAYAEMFPPIRESVRAHGLTLGTIILFFIFFMTSMRFFVGNQLHLLSESCLRMRGDMWLYDFLIITYQTLILCFLGGLSSVAINYRVQIDFVDLLIFLYAVDIVWIVSQKLFGLFFKGWNREFIPWAWAILNGLLVVGIVVLRLLIDDIFSNQGLIWLGVLSGVAFILDIILIDHYDII
jgi:hypothetical protein